MSYISPGTLFGENDYGDATYGSPLGGTVTVPSFSAAPLVAEPVGYTAVQLTWSLPTSGYILQLVRNSFSVPTDQNDGETLAQFSSGGGSAWPQPSFLDGSITGTQGGVWLYYSLFMLTSIGGYWLRSADAQVMVPENWGNAARMFSLLPQYYQNLDDSMYDPFFVPVSSSTWGSIEGLTWKRMIGAE